MGVYSCDSCIYGIRIYKFNDGFANILYEKIFNEIMTYEEKTNAYLFYTELENKNDMLFQFYTDFSSTCEEGVYFLWHPVSLELFLYNFGL
jgi:hypothetical protein